jgi:threonine dehydrogenase-like Zn-dependent dehydrogenase
MLGDLSDAHETVRAIHIVGANRFEFVEKPIPSAGQGVVLAAPAYVGICGTDLELLHGTMPYLAQGRARYPVQPGHEWSGTVLESYDPRVAAGQWVIMDPVVGCGHCEPCATGPATHCQRRIEIGITIGLDGALATRIAAPTTNLIPIPAGVRLRDAALVEPMVTVLSGIERTRPQPGEEALVVGSGTLGLLAAMILSSRGLRTHVLTRNPVRLTTVEAAGGVPWPVGTKAAVSAYDVVIEAAGTVDGIQAALAAAALGGRVAILGVPSSPVTVDIASMVFRDVAVYGVLNGPGQFLTALDAIASGIVRPEVIIDRIFPFEDVAAAFTRSHERDRARPKVLVQVDPAAAGA